MTPFELTQVYIAALTGDANTVCDWRVINDRDKACSGRNIRGTLSEVYNTLQGYNQQGWGVFMCINPMDGQGQSLPNVAYIRTHIADLDDTLLADAAYSRAVSSQIPPHFAVQSSTGKYHLYWLMEHYTGNDFYSTIQRKLAQVFDGDRTVTDATRVLRVPGFYHCKGEPQYVTCWSIGGHAKYQWQQMEGFLAHVNVFEATSTRKELGDEKLSAPSLTILQAALNMIDPNNLSYDEWVAVSAAFKQAGWNHADEATLMGIWANWCAQYAENNHGENNKLWGALKDTQVGWRKFRHLTAVDAYMNYGVNEDGSLKLTPPPRTEVKPTLELPPKPAYPPVMGPADKADYFKDCFFIEKFGKILTPSGIYMDANRFNGSYGGYEFLLGDMSNRKTDEPWKAALRSTDWSIPVVNHVRFLPLEKPFGIVTDRRGRKGVNTYTPVIPDMYEGDVSLFIKHVQNLIGSPADVKIWCDYMAHIIKFPGYKVPWAPLLQSGEGAGKTVFFEVLQHALGEMYIYKPKAQELPSSGSKFNAWMREKLAIVVDEIKTDEKRELVEILKPLISDALVEVQSKGVDQDMEDNVANWVFFSNFPDAIPINENSRRFAVFYSPIQTNRHMTKAGMGKEYFDRLFNWLHNEGGLQKITYWFMNYPIERGDLPVRAPWTSSHQKALKISRTPLQILLDDKIRAGERGFRNGFVSLTAFTKAVANSNMRHKPAEYVLRETLEKLDYVEIGDTPYPIMSEDISLPSTIYSKNEDADPADYERLQNS